MLDTPDPSEEKYSDLIDDPNLKVRVISLHIFLGQWTSYTFCFTLSIKDE